MRGRHLLIATVLIGVTLLHWPATVAAEGSRSLYPADAAGFRANLEWRNSSYGNGLLLRRTLLKVYVEAGEVILMGSSAVDVPGRLTDRGDILLYAPGRITGPIGNEIVPAAADFGCLAQRRATGNIRQGRIFGRVAEVRGPDTIIDPATARSGGGVPGGYVPCFYQAPASGIYDVVFYGPSGDERDSETLPTGSIVDVPRNFDASQDTSIALWDVTVREGLTNTNDITGRLFTYYVTMFTGDNGRPVNSIIYVVTRDGFRYRLDLRGMDPNGYVIYANQVGFLDSDGAPLYRDVLADPSLPTQEQNQLVRLQGGVSLAPPDYPIFFNPPAPETLRAIGIPLDPIVPEVSDLSFIGSEGNNVTAPGKGGLFRFTSTVGGVYELIISRDGINWDPSDERNRALRGVKKAGGMTEVRWDGNDNAGTPFPEGLTYLARISVRGGELHFPFLDVENSIQGGPSMTLLNPPGGACPPWNPTCTRAFYDDRGYRTASDQLVGTAIDGPLCLDNVGNPPNQPFASPPNGFDTFSDQRAYGFASGGNPSGVCNRDGGFGDKKGLDIWMTYPGNTVETRLNIISTTAIELVSLRATPVIGGIAVEWETGAERGTWGFYVLRGGDNGRAGAARISGTLIPARGHAREGAVYHFLDTTAQPGQPYSYWLQEIELDGTANEYGPVRATAQSAPSSRTYLPMVAQ
jgi:hypothetical protein